MSPHNVRRPNGRKWTLVTGAAGFIAFHLIQRCLEAGNPVLGIDNLDPFYPVELKRKNLTDLDEIARRAGTPFQFHKRDVSELAPAWFGDLEIERIVHLAAKAGVRPSLHAPEAYLKANVQGTLRVLEFCRHRGVPDLVFGSSSSVYGNQAPVPFREDGPADRPISPYAATKRTGELYCHAYAHLYGLKIAALRFFTVYGPRQRPDLAIHKFARAIDAGEAITLFGDGSTSRDYTYVSDIIEGVTAAMNWVKRASPGTYEIFNLGGSRITTLKRLVELLESALGRTARVEWQTPEPGDVERTFADTSKSQAHLGYSPKIGMEEGIEKFVEWFQAARFEKRAA